MMTACSIYIRIAIHIRRHGPDGARQSRPPLSLGHARFRRVARRRTFEPTRQPHLRHGVIIATVSQLFLPAVKALGGLAIVEPGIVWSEEAEDNVVPDVAIVLPDRLHLATGRTLSGFLHRAGQGTDILRAVVPRALRLR